ncbi:MAG TPA: hypothetical protein VJ953_02345 [Saprospiraceae bacterium]|nr:hypothetical protein [Saprospiraceae bacterium]
MKQLLFPVFCLLFLPLISSAQYTTVTYEFDKQWFNEGQPLPVASNMIIKGTVPATVAYIEIQVLSTKGQELYRAQSVVQNNREFAVPVNFPLRSGDNYDFRVNLFQEMSTAEKNNLRERTLATLNTYLDVNLKGDKTIKLVKRSKKTVRDMNDLLVSLLERYRNTLGNWTPTFSDVVRLKLEQLDKADLDQDYDKKDTTATRASTLATTRNRLVSELRAQVAREANQILDAYPLILKQSQTINDYPTINQERALSLSAGYGGVYLSGDWDDFNYGASPYFGLAFPLGRAAMGANFWSNTAITAGFFLNNFEDEEGNAISGLIVDRPLYFGLDHKLFKFVHLNLGGTLLENETANGTGSSREVLIRPFIGLSARIDLTLGLGK